MARDIRELDGTRFESDVGEDWLKSMAAVVATALDLFG